MPRLSGCRSNIRGMILRLPRTTLRRREHPTPLENRICSPLMRDLGIPPAAGIMVGPLPAPYVLARYASALDSSAIDSLSMRRVGGHRSLATKLGNGFPYSRSSLRRGRLPRCIFASAPRLEPAETSDTSQKSGTLPQRPVTQIIPCPNIKMEGAMALWLDCGHPR